MTPSMIVDGKVFNCETLKLQYDSYVQLYRSTDNTPKLRSVGAIALIPSNKHGIYWFMSLKTGHKLYRYHWVELPISDDVIDRVEQLAQEQGQPLMENGQIFEWSPGDLIVDMDDDPEVMHEKMDEVEYPADDDYHNQDPNAGGIPIATRATIITDDEELEDLDEGRSNDADEYEGDWTTKLNQGDDQEESEEEYKARSDSKNSQLERESNVEESGVQVDTESSEEEEPIENDTAMGQDTEAESQGNNMRPRRANAGKGVTRLELSMRGKSHQDTRVHFTQKGTTKGGGKHEWFAKLKDIAVNACFTQMSARKGIEQFGKLAVTAMLKEYKQLDNLVVFGAVSPESMSKQEFCDP